MPRLSDSMTEGTVVRWLKQPGDHVRRGEPLVEVETDKATLTYESDVEGVLTEIAVGEGQTVAVGTPIAWVEPQQEGAGQAAPQPTMPGSPPPLPTPPQETGEVPPLPLPDDAPLIDQPTTEQPPPLAVPEPPEPPEPTESEPSGTQSPHDIFTQEADEFSPPEEYADAAPEQRVKASPIARRLARKLGLNIAAISGSGPDGRVVKEDVEAAADAAARAQAAASTPTQAPAPPTPPPVETLESDLPPGLAEPPPPLPAEPKAPLPPLVDVDPQQPPSPPPAAPQPPPQPPEPQQPSPPQPSPQQPSPPAPTPQPQRPAEPEPALIPNFPPPPTPAPPPQPATPQPQFQQPPAFPSPPPFVAGMTGNFPAVPGPQQQQQYPQQPPQYQQAPPGYPQQPQQYQQAPPPGYPQQPMQPPPVQQQPPAQQPPPVQPQQVTPQNVPPRAAGPGIETATRGHATPIEPTTAQQTVARRMSESKATAPEFYVETEVDMTTCVAFREQLRASVNPLPSFNDFVIKAAGQALRQYPNVNAAYRDGHFEQYSDVNIGVVVSATELLAVPTLFNVDQKGLAQIAQESQQLSESVRSRTIQPSQMSGGTFSVSNLGMYGVDRFTAILNPPQAAILAVGSINRRAVIAEDGMSLVIRQIMNMTLTCDHRILYGAEAAEFLGAIKAWLESPQLLQV